MIGRWALIVGLAATPALIAGPSAACAAGIGFGFDPRAFLPVIALAGFVQGLIVAWLAGAGARLGPVDRWLARRRSPTAVAWATRWGAWVGLFAGGAIVGQEPVLVALRAVQVPIRRLAAPLALSNAAFTALYYAIVRLGLDRAAPALQP